MISSIDDAFKLTEEKIKMTLCGAPADIRNMTSHMSGAMGKGVRARILLLAAMHDDGTISEDAVRAATAIELFHLATLVHDDVIDDAPVRRGLPTVQSIFGKKQAVICGDYLLCLAAGIIADLDREYINNSTSILPQFVSSMKKICIGEHLQGLHIGDLNLSIFNYLKIIDGKTATLFYLSAYAGGVIESKGRVEQNVRKIKALAGFGKQLGMLFQIADDLKDYESTPENAKKPVKTDIAIGVVTLPLILAMAKAPYVRDLALSCIRAGQADAGLIQSLSKSGGLDEARALAKKFRQKAEIYLDRAALNAQKQQLFLQVLHGIS